MQRKQLKTLTTSRSDIGRLTARHNSGSNPRFVVLPPIAQNSNDMTTNKQTPNKPKRKAQKPPKQPKMDMFTAICKSDLKIEVVKEYLFHPTRKWRFDYAIPDHKIALEVEGGVWTGGRHTRPQGFLGDIEKYNAGTLLGWRIFRVTPDDLCRLKTLELIKQAISV